RARHIKLVVAAVPRCTVDNAAVRRKSRVADRARAKSDLLILGLRRMTARASAPPPETINQTRKREPSRDPSQKFVARLAHRKARATARRRDPRRAPGKPREMFEIKRNIAGGMEARLGVLFQAVVHNALQCRRNIAIRFTQLRRIFLQNRTHRIRGSVSMERPFAREHFVENCPKAEYV